MLRLTGSPMANAERYTQDATANGVQLTGHGKTMPIADNSTAEGRALNRRVEFKILSQQRLTHSN